jgi:hypothetical protein
VQQQVAEVAGVQGLQALLVGLVELDRAATGEIADLARETRSGVRPRSFQRWMIASMARAGHASHRRSLPAAPA